MPRQEKLHPFKVLKYLPNTNCKQCGFSTCLAFGVDLMARKVKVEDCPFLLEEKYKSSYEFLFKHFGKEVSIEHSGLIIDKDKCLGCGDCVVVCNKCQYTIIHGSNVMLERNVPPVFKIINGKIEVLNWNSCKRCTDPPGICRVCEERCSFGALELVSV